MATDLEKRAKAAFVDDDFELAVGLYGQAIELDPNNADLFADRAQAYIKLGSFTEAVADASRAIELDPSMSKAYLRKGTACIKLEEYHTAKAALEAGLDLAPTEPRFVRLIKECEKHIEEETKNSPAKVIPDAAATLLSSTTHMVTNGENNSGQAHEMSEQLNLQQNKLKYRHDYYNSTAEVVLTIFAKGIPAERVLVDFGEQILSVTIDVPGEEAYHFQPRLFGKILPEKSTYKVFASKIEIRLAKAEATAWPSLEFSKEKSSAQKRIVSPGVDTTKSSTRPSYPSSKNKVNWDKLEAEVKKQEKDEKLEGDAALNKLFRDIYRDGDEDMRRAMMKSFVESNGTVLSTNWKDVGTKKVEGSPPDGMELKKWEY
ncbi:protein SGT1 homolog [Dioscorea cayenensis subsp. rotundata]|uniref:Protein SGT1 homolog n=1 Tax=Dioscorea cayennensis subsp. rotundata TaxID=55577 RepID=A0AB40ANB3_DIOCR|nr:protein SGT1 homolog [Dioscorea cayenensis subsp. rotundata]